MSQFTKMLEPSPPKNYEQTELGRSILSPVAFPAKMYHVPALEKALKTAMGKLLGQGCGENTQESLANLDQNGLWLRMCEGCCQQVLISDREETSELFSGTWPTWGLMRSGRVTVLKPLVRRTKGKESLLWHTARANKIGGSTSEGYGLCLEEAVKGGRKQNWPTPSTQEIEHAGCELTKTGRRKSKNGDNSYSVNLADTVKMWRTPDANLGARGPKSAKMYEECKKTNKHALNLLDQVKHECNWPTPAARDWKDSGDLQKLADSTHQACVPKMVARLELKNNVGKKGSLNADWVELLMGLPIGWTNLDKQNKDLSEQPGWPAPMNATRQWATPNTMDMLPSRSYEAMKNQATNGARKNRTAPGNLREQIDPLMRKAYVDASKENGGKLIEEITVSGQYSYEPPRVTEGQKNRAKRLKCLGNGCCPLQVYPIFKIIMEVEKGGHK